MKVSHWVETTDQEANDLYMMVITVATANYQSIEEQDEAIVYAMPEFKAALDDLISQAFELGFKKMKKIHKAKAEACEDHSSTVMP